MGDPGLTAESFHDFAMSSGDGVLQEYADELLELGVTSRSLLRDGILEQLVAAGIPQIPASDIVDAFSEKFGRGSVGIFWDYESVSLDQAHTTTLHAIGAVRNRLGIFGNISVMNLYTPSGSLNDRHAVALQDAGAQILAVPRVRKRGSMTSFQDKPIIVDSLCFAYQTKDPIVCIVSSDSDFAPLLSRLQMMGARAIMVTSDNTAGRMVYGCATVTLSFPSSFLPYMMVVPSLSQQQQQQTGNSGAAADDDGTMMAQRHNQLRPFPTNQQQQSGGPRSPARAGSASGGGSSSGSGGGGGRPPRYSPGRHGSRNNHRNNSRSTSRGRNRESPARGGGGRHSGGSDSNNNNDDSSSRAPPPSYSDTMNTGQQQRGASSSPSGAIVVEDASPSPPKISVEEASPTTTDTAAASPASAASTQSPKQQQSSPQLKEGADNKEATNTNDKNNKNDNQEEYVTLSVQPKWNVSSNPLAKFGIAFQPLISSSFDHNSPRNQTPASSFDQTNAAAADGGSDTKEEGSPPSSATSGGAWQNTKFVPRHHPNQHERRSSSFGYADAEDLELFPTLDSFAARSDTSDIEKLDLILKTLHSITGSGEITRAQVAVEVRQTMGAIDFNALMRRAEAMGRVQVGGSGSTAWVARVKQEEQDEEEEEEEEDTAGDNVNKAAESPTLLPQPTPSDDDHDKSSSAAPSPSPAKQSAAATATTAGGGESTEQQRDASSSTAAASSQSKSQSHLRANTTSRRSGGGGRRGRSRDRHSASPLPHEKCWMSFRLNKELPASQVVLRFPASSLPKGVDAVDVDQNASYHIRAFGPFADSQEALAFQKKWFSKLPYRPRYYSTPPK